jgi:tetratricopeptide (TPR) repeat protein
MAGRYGMSFAKNHIEEGEYEKAIAAASASIADGDHGPEPLFDRATALDLAERYEEAVADFEAAIERNRSEQEVDPFTIDDAYFSALLEAARRAAAKDVEKGIGLLKRYSTHVHDGEHHEESLDWQKRLRGELPSLLDKTKSVDAS